MSLRAIFSGNSRVQLGVSLLLGLSLFTLGLTHCSSRLKESSPATSPSALPRQQARRLYAQAVVVNRLAKPELLRTARDVAELLSRATGSIFRVSTAIEPGIRLLRADGQLAPLEMVKKLRGCGPEAFAIGSGVSGELNIVANSDEGLIYGAYEFLRSLGFRFYYPSPHWTIVPKLHDIEQPFPHFGKPAFRMRRFVGTGGFGKHLVMDPHGDLAQRWATWKLRNGFGGEFHVDGHSGEAFNIRHKQKLLEDPALLASVKGRRVAWSKIAKLDPSNPAAVDLYVKDRLAEFRAKKARDPHGPGSFAVSVEPADGGGHCDSVDCEKLGSISDREFLIANHVARALATEYPGARASLFAYNFHAQIPSIDIEPNVYVTLVPYAFQRDGDDPEEFIAAWAQKKQPLSIYDYWSIPDWHHDLPAFDYSNVPGQKIRFWREHQVEGFLGETTYSSGAMGLGWYIAGRLLWDPDANPAAIAQEFYRLAFGDAANSMRRMLERWASGFLLNSIELRASFSDLRQAFHSESSPAIRQRLVDYAGYVQYLRLRHEYANASKQEKSPRKRALLLHLWRMHASSMVNTFRLQQLLLRGDRELANEFDPRNASLPVWKTLTPPTLEDALQFVSAGRRDFRDLGVQHKVYDGDLTLVQPDGPEQGSPASAGLPPLTLVGTNRLELTIPSQSRGFSAELRTNGLLRLNLRDGSAVTVARAELQASADARIFEISGLKPGNYTLDLRTAKTGVVRITFSDGLGIELETVRVPKAVPVPDLYFYVPQTEHAVALHDPIALPPTSGAILLDPFGQQQPLERFDGGRLLIARASPEQRGKVWVLRRATSPDGALRLINVPQRLALTPAALRVPTSALRMGRAQ
jgi:hypothetical protein